MTTSTQRFWKTDWDTARANLIKWWRHEGLAAHVVSPADRPWEDLPEPPRPDNPRDYWMDPKSRLERAVHHMATTFWGGEAFPYFDTNIGPGSLANYLGSEPGFAFDTVWYEPCIKDLDTHPPLRFDPGAKWFVAQMAIIERGVAAADGRFLVGMPDVIENIDILAAMRDPQTLLMDMVEQPAAVERRVEEINRAYFDCFDAIYERIKTPWGGNAFAAFRIWGPGRTAKVQCDACAMFSPAMFRRFVQPALREQCAWLDYSVYHLDGPQAICHLDALLEIEELDAIQYTPGAAFANGGDPHWHAMYKRILAAGKSLHVSSKPELVLPLLDTLGGKGVFVLTAAPNETEARALLEQIDAYR